MRVVPQALAHRMSAGRGHGKGGGGGGGVGGGGGGGGVGGRGGGGGKGGGKGAGGEYISLAYGNDGRDLESRGVKKLRASAPSSSSSLSHGFSLEGSQLEKSAAAILEGISKRAYT